MKHKKSQVEKIMEKYKTKGGISTSIRMPVDSNSIYFKNIYGFTLKKINFQCMKGSKVVKNQHFNNNIMLLFGDKYDEMIEVKLDLINSKNYSVNGQFFSKTGLNDFIRLIK